MAKKKLSGAELFENYYSEVYGNRWALLKESFAKESLYFELKHEGCESYFLDSASVLAASCLPIDSAENILDLCAAPGGKSLVLATRMNENCSLVSNERSAERRNRLLTVVHDSLPTIISSRVTVTAFDGSLVCKKYEPIFDSILLDAPCSSERHVFSSPKYLDQWTPARIKNLSFTQWSLLSSSFLVLKEGGYLLYSTCAIAPDENDNVVKKLLKKYDSASLIDIDFSKVYSSLPSLLNISLLKPEKTECGYHILPDKNDGAGPLYFSLIQKKNLDGCLFMD